VKRIQYDPKNDYYQRIGVTPQVTLEELQQAYRKKAKELHPDLNPPERREWATSQFQLLNEAYDVLGDPDKRQLYDKQRWPFIGGNSSQKPSSPSARRAAAVDDWWNVPHPRQPGYDGVKIHAAPPPPVRTASKAQAKWLDQSGLGFLKPMYLSITELIIGPYRWLLAILVVALLLNLMLIFYAGLIAPPDPPQEEDQFLLPTQNPVVSVAEGIIPTPTVGVRDTVELIPCPQEAQLFVHDYEQVNGRIMLSARVENTFLAHNVLVRAVNGVDGDHILVEGLWQPAELYLTVEEEIDRASELPINPQYLLQWTPILPDGSSLDPCQQLIDVK
jgi:curved DNA-binding protein CbpA